MNGCTALLAKICLTPLQALGLFEEAAKRAVENNLLKFSARGYLLNAGAPWLVQACMWGRMIAGIYINIVSGQNS